MKLIVRSEISIGSGVLATIKSNHVNVIASMNEIKSGLIQHMAGNKLIIDKVKLFTNINNNYIIELEINKSIQFVDYNCYEYDLYRSINSTANFSLIASKIHPLTKYIDTDVNMQNVEMDYYYKAILRNKITNETEEI